MNNQHIEDEAIRRLIVAEEKRQREGLEMIPSENHTSLEVLHALPTNIPKATRAYATTAVAR